MVFATSLALWVATIIFLNRGVPKGGAVDPEGARLLWLATLHSPFYWLTLVAILLLAGWLLKRWLTVLPK
jgi:hypothetical protein